VICGQLLLLNKTKREPSLWLRNIQLALYGTVVAVVGLIAQQDPLIGSDGLFYGFTSLVWFSVFWQAGGGLIVALTIKYADSILRCFAQAGAIILIAVVSSIFLDFVITIEFSVGVTLVIISVFLYGGKAETPLQSFQGFKTCLCAEWYGSMSVQEDEEGDVDLELEGDVDLELEGDVNLDASLHERQIDKDAAGDDVFHLQDAGPKPAGSNTTATEAAGRVAPSVNPRRVCHLLLWPMAGFCFGLAVWIAVAVQAQRHDVQIPSWLLAAPEPPATATPQAPQWPPTSSPLSSPPSPPPPLAPTPSPPPPPPTPTLLPPSSQSSPPPPASRASSAGGQSQQRVGSSPSPTPPLPSPQPPPGNAPPLQLCATKTLCHRQDLGGPPPELYTDNGDLTLESCAATCAQLEGAHEELFGWSPVLGGHGGNGQAGQAKCRCCTAGPLPDDGLNPHSQFDLYAAHGTCAIPPSPPPPPPWAPQPPQTPPLPPARCSQQKCTSMGSNGPDCCAGDGEPMSCADGYAPKLLGGCEYTCCTPECWVCASLWTTPAASSERPWVLPRAELPKVRSIGVVLAYCNHDLTWLTDYIENLRVVSNVATITVYIYSKCGQEIHVPVQWAPNVVTRPNTGRNDQTYAHHIVLRDNLLEEINFFIKDTMDPVHPQGSWWGVASLKTSDDVYPEVATLGFACHSTALPTWDNGGAAHSVWHSVQNLGSLQLDDYKNGGGQFKASVRPMGAWLDTMVANDMSIPTYWPVCYQGNFAASKERIQAVPFAVWERITASLSRAENIEEGHYMERTWAGVLSPQISQVDQELLLSHRGPIANCDPNYEGNGDYGKMFESLRCGAHGIFSLANCQC